MSVEANTAASKAAVAVIDLAMTEAANHKDAARSCFWGRIRESAIAICPPIRELAPPTEPSAMTNEESRKWGATQIPFGGHIGIRVDNVPMDYLLWLDDQPDFRRELRRYLASERIQREQE